MSIRDAIFYNGDVATSAASVFECRNALDGTIISFRAINTNASARTIGLCVKPADSSSWTADRSNAVYWNEPIPAQSSIEKKVWIPLHDGDQIHMVASGSDVSAYLAGYQRTTT